MITKRHKSLLKMCTRMYVCVCLWKKYIEKMYHFFSFRLNISDHFNSFLWAVLECAVILFHTNHSIKFSSKFILFSKTFYRRKAFKRLRKYLILFCIKWLISTDKRGYYYLYFNKQLNYKIKWLLVTIILHKNAHFFIFT